MPKSQKPFSGNGDVLNPDTLDESGLKVRDSLLSQLEGGENPVLVSLANRYALLSQQWATLAGGMFHGDFGTSQSKVFSTGKPGEQVPVPELETLARLTDQLLAMESQLGIGPNLTRDTNHG